MDETEFTDWEARSVRVVLIGSYTFIARLYAFLLQEK